ncbi:aminotransferase class III-fold pyridoxal phosphate-dependent enzyme [Nonomuraea sp. NPDC026600]|uniref:aspartate aminotransferase family protein n=1 Tax=Nonomuraea sp. NPDC026600 TaxID=3155363 RepID=UPI00340C09DC
MTTVGADRMADLVAEYRARTPRSAAAHERAVRVLPGGETRSITTYPPHPVALAEGHGARLRDVDGHTYLDLVNNYTSLVHGNAFPPVTEAVTAILAGGLAFASAHQRQIELAELLADRVPSVERVRFTNSGTEASILASRLVRRATGRKALLMFDGAYHGSMPPLLPGEPDVVVVPYNDLQAVGEALTDDVAAVFAEPFLGAGGVVPAAPGFLAGVQDLARSRGALFVLDEIQALRNGVAGEQGRQGLSPDLTLLGKIIGGGMPIGAVGGRADVMLLAASTTPGSITHAGTFNGHLAAAVAGMVTLRHLDAPAIATLEGHAVRLAEAVTAAGRDAGLPLSVTRAGSILNVHFAAEAPSDAAGVRAAASPLLAALHLALLLEGVYTAPRGLINMSTALTDDDIDRAAAAYSTALRRIAW